MSVLALLSPAKTFQKEDALQAFSANKTQPVFLEQAETLIKVLREYSPKDISELMSVSENISALNHGRFQDWNTDAHSDGKTALGTFYGDAFKTLEADLWEPKDVDFAQQHLRILSGLYGMLKPLDAILEYRLEMGTRLPVNTHNNLYSFWKKTLAKALESELTSLEATWILNTASNEYSKALSLATASVPVIVPEFLDEKDGVYKARFLYVKQARGAMVRWACSQRVAKADELKDFQEGGYQYSETKGNSMIFRRTEKDRVRNA